MDSNAYALLILVGLPSVICFVAGALHGLRTSMTRRGVLIGAALVSALTCWSIGIGGGDMPGAMVLPSWLMSPMAPFMGSRDSVVPPWWLTPWLPFALYALGALFSHPRRGDSQDT